MPLNLEIHCLWILEIQALSILLQEKVFNLAFIWGTDYALHLNLFIIVFVRYVLSIYCFCISD